ncbi:MAG: invasion associated locus B family protein [Pseudomonadota bacterium]
MTDLMKGVFLASVMAAASVGPLWAQDETSDNRVGAETDWSVFVEEDPLQCWVVSTPREIRNTRDDREVAVTRGEILFFVSFWPEQGRSGEVSYTGGYPFEVGSTVSVSIGDSDFQFFTEGELAWATTEQQDDQVITAMKRGAEAVLTARSTRGTQTEDTFSLLGFTAAIEDAEARCGG